MLDMCPPLPPTTINAHHFILSLPLLHFLPFAAAIPRQLHHLHLHLFFPFFFFFFVLAVEGLLPEELRRRRRCSTAAQPPSLRVQPHFKFRTPSEYNPKP